MFRVRTKGGFSYATTQEEYSTWSSCSQTTETVTSSFQWVKVGEKITFSDVLTPSFHKRKSSGEIIMNPMTYVKKTSIHDAGTGISRKKNTSITCGGVQQFQILRNKYWTGTHYFTPDSDGTIAPSAELIPQSEISDLIAEHSTSVLSKRCRPDNNLFETLAELDKSISLLPNLLEGIRRRVPKGKLAFVGGSLAAAWLSYRYGIMPLIRDVNSVLKGLEKKLKRIRETTRSNSPTISRFQTSELFGPGSTTSHRFGISEIHRVKVRVMSIDEYDLTRAQAIGFDFSKLLTLPWELIPYSFVIDWFANVGDYINAAVPQFGCKQLGGCLVLEDEKVFLLTHLQDVPVSGWTILSPSNGSYISSVISRRRIPAPLQARLVMKNDFRFSNATRVLDAVSLLLAKIR